MSSDYGDFCKEVRERKQKQHQSNFVHNMKILGESGLKYELKDTTCLFREKDKPRIDFYPHSDKWKALDEGGKICNGGAKKFISWYNKQFLAIIE